ncbi:unnamed protein product [Schistosoma margrebowiei]|uniref:Uncharacterized protein n=1 Tax=Schistosoma margrebowiei TaxID=48269 RepID=A0A183LPR8_9TREM|nr:unnamed protein product [Schistosoma margrebowiei]
MCAKMARCSLFKYIFLPSGPFTIINRSTGSRCFCWHTDIYQSVVRKFTNTII